MQTETITCLIGTAPLIIAIYISILSLACVFIEVASCIPQYFRDLKDSRDKKILNSMREKLREEIYTERSTHRLKLEQCRVENITLKKDIDILERKIFSYKSKLEDLNKVKGIIDRWG